MSCGNFSVTPSTWAAYVGRRVALNDRLRVTWFAETLGGGHTREEDVEVSPTQNRTLPSTERVIMPSGNFSATPSTSAACVGWSDQLEVKRRETGQGAAPLSDGKFSSA